MSSKSIRLVCLALIACLIIEPVAFAQQVKSKNKRPIATKPAQRKPGVEQAGKNPAQTTTRPAGSTTNQRRTGTAPAVRTGTTASRANNKNGNKTVNINVDRSRDINVHNTRNTAVRRNVHRPYTRAPYVHGGFRYYSHRPYFYHPYRPFFWGPAYHPWGFFVAALATTAILVTIADQQYHYDSGVYYIAGNGGYTVVQAPVGAVITTLPANSQSVVVSENVTNYYYGGTFYEKSSNGYTVVPPTAGTVIESLPEGGKEVKIGDVTYVKFGETYYQPIQQEGKNMYEVVQVEEDK